MNQGIILPLILLGILVVSVAVFFIIDKRKNKKSNKVNKVSNQKNTGKNNNSAATTDNEKVLLKNKEQENIAKEDIFNFMQFERIQDDMIISEKNDKYTMVIQCKGINYDLMSEVEQLAVEEGFITFLNTLRYPVQLYVQTRSIDLKESVNMFKGRLEGFARSFEEVNEKYTEAVNSPNYDSKDIKNIEYERNKQLNIMEYTQDITRYVERMSLNKKMLQKKYYVILSYYKSDINSTNNFNDTEINDIAYRELFTRSQSIIGALQTCSVSGKVLESNDLAELLYVSYNRDDAKLIDIKQALESGFYRLYSTSEDTFVKRRNLLLKSIQDDAKAQAIYAIQQAVAEGTIQTEDEFIDNYDEDVAAVALQIINESDATEEIKEKAKYVIAENHLNNLKQKAQKKEKKKIEEVTESEAKIEESEEDIEELENKPLM